MVLFPDLTQLDLTGPYEVFVRTPGAEVHLLSSSLDAVRAEGAWPSFRTRPSPTRPT